MSHYGRGETTGAGYTGQYGSQRYYASSADRAPIETTEIVADSGYVSRPPVSYYHYPEGNAEPYTSTQHVVKEPYTSTQQVVRSYDVHSRSPAPTKYGEYTSSYRDYPSTPAPAPASPATLPKLYVARASSNCLGPWLLLREAGVQFELIDVDIAKGETHTPEFLSMNPMGKVPVFVAADGSVVWESSSIMRYICMKHSLPDAFYPANANMRGRVEMALDWRNSCLYPNIQKVTYPNLGFSKDRSKIAEGKTALDKDLKVLTDFFLRETPFVGGSVPCIADYAIAFPLLYLYATDYRTPPKVREYLEHLASKCPRWNEVTDALKNYMSALK